MGQLAAGVAHDFRNKLAILRGVIDLIGDPQTRPDEVSSLCAEAGTAIERASSLVAQLLAFGRKEMLLAQDTDRLLASRESLLQAQRNGVLLAMVAMLALVLAGFIAAYISIMRGLNGLSAAVNTMADGDLSARVEITTNDEIGAVGTQFNLMVENLAQRTALLREKTNDIQTMLQNLPQGILTIVAGGAIHPEYSDYLETIFETKDVGERPAIDFIFGGDGLGADALAQVEATVFACLGEDRINFDFNSHLLAGELSKTMADGRIKHLELSWSPICNESGTVEKIMVCVRDVSALRQLEAEAEQQKRELQMIGQILAISQEKFDEFATSARRFIAHNESLLQAAEGASAELAAQLFRNMHTIKGNARTYGLLQLTHVVHRAEQAYDELRQGGAFERSKLLEQLQEVATSVDEYTALNDDKLGRKGPGRRGSAEKYLMVERAQIDQLVADLGQIVSQQPTRPEWLAPALQQIKLDLQRLGCENDREYPRQRLRLAAVARQRTFQGGAAAQGSRPRNFPAQPDRRHAAQRLHASLPQFARPRHRRSRRSLCRRQASGRNHRARPRTERRAAGAAPGRRRSWTRARRDPPQGGRKRLAGRRRRGQATKPSPS